MPLNVVIAGAGIAGLSAAIACRRAGHIVNIYERSRLNHEVGAAIHIPPNASRALIAWGLDPERARFVVTKKSFRAYGDTLVKFHETDESYIESTFGAPWFLSHRVDLHEELKSLATGEEGAGLPAKIHLGNGVASYDPEGSFIILASGIIVTGDVIIAADGVHTKAVEAISGSPNPALPIAEYNLAYRFLIPSSEIDSDPETAQFGGKADDGRMKFIVGDRKRLVWYPCRGNTVHNLTAIFSGDISDVPEEWQVPVEKSKLLDRYSKFHPAVLTVLNKATDITQWPLLFRRPLPSWHKGKLLLIGDASHPMLPNQGQGGAQAIEDAVALGFCLSNLEASPPPSVLEKRLEIFEDIRVRRASVMQIFSNAGQDEPEKIRKAASQFIPENEIPQSPEGYFKHNFGYDIVRDCERKMAAKDPTWELPKTFFEKTPGRGVYP